MKKNQILKAIVAIVIILALILPSSAMFDIGTTINNNTSTNSNDTEQNIKEIDTRNDGPNELWNIDWWPMSRHDLANTGFSTTNIVPITNNVIWIHNTGIDKGRVWSSPAIIDERVYYGCDDGNFYCLNASDGSLIWNYTTGDFNIHSQPHYIRSSPTVVDGKVFVGSLANNTYCLDASDGSLIWKYTTGDMIHSSPAVIDGKIFIGSNDNNLYCLDIDGELIWSFATGDNIISSPAIADGKIYVGSNDHKVYCLDIMDGSFVWNYTTGDWVVSSPAVVDGKVYVGSYDRKIYCLDAYIGNHIWSYNTTINAISSSPAVADGKVYFGGDYDFYCLDASNGSLIWNNTGWGWGYSSPAIADGKIYTGSNYNFHCLNASDGFEIWEDNHPLLAFTGNPAIANKRVYIGRSTCCGNTTGNLYCYERSNHDIGIINRTSPVSGSATIFTPEVIIKNFGLNNETDVPVNMEISRFQTPFWVVEYNKTVYVDIDSEEIKSVIFPDWMPDNLYGGSGSIRYRVTASIQLVTDTNPNNDELVETITLDYIHDIGVKEITEPSGSLPPGTYPVECIVKNYGSFNESDFNVNATIYNETEETFYHDDFLVITTMHLQDEITVAFDNVTFEGGDAGSYRLEVFTELDGDDNPLNDLAILNFIIGNDTTPPVTICELDVYITDVTVTLTATDDLSGVNYTIYKINDGEWQNYTIPFIVSEDGEHTVYFYSVDNAGNTEDTKNESFTIQHPCPIEIEVSGGIGVNAVITNIGDMDIIDLEWSITIIGGIFDFIDKEVNGTIPDLAIGEEKTVSSGLFLGLGSISITVIADDAEEIREGKQLIIFTKVE